MALNLVQQSFILASGITGCVISISVFTSLIGICISTATSAVRVKDCVISAGIKKYKSIKKKKRKKHDNLVLPGKDKLNTKEVLICKE